MITVGATAMRVLAGLLIASVLPITIGVLVRYFLVFEQLTLPTITLLSPVSPIAWLPVAIFLFGIGNAPAIFMVVIALFFHMVLATISQIDGVNRNLINVARTMGATKRQIYSRVIIPAILPGLLMVLRLNLFAAWMVVLVAESTGVGYGLGQVIMMARNTFNPSLVFFTIALIGLLGFTFDLTVAPGAEARSSTGCRSRRGCCVASEQPRPKPFSSKSSVICRDVSQDLGGRHRACARGAARHRSRHRARRVRGLPRTIRLRQEHTALSDGGARSGDRRRDLVVRRPRRPRPRPSAA